jgi:hypothetical protein
LTIKETVKIREEGIISSSFFPYFMFITGAFEVEIHFGL